MTEEECTIEDIGGFLEDRTARRILIEASAEPVSAETLSEATGVSKPTIYRRLAAMRRCDLLVERTQLDPEGGHHHTRFATNLERIVVELTEDGMNYELHHREAMADRFTRLIEGM